LVLFIYSLIRAFLFISFVSFILMVINVFIRKLLFQLWLFLFVNLFGLSVQTKVQNLKNTTIITKIVNSTNYI
jgi:hypothetical protein